MNQWHLGRFATAPRANGYRWTPTTAYLARARRGLASILALTVLALPVASALSADHGQEITPAMAPVASGGAAAYTSATPESSSTKSAPEVIAANPGLLASGPGLVADQADPAQANGAPTAEPGYAAGAGGPRTERPASLNGDMYSGGLLVGLLALEYASQHPHH